MACLTSRAPGRDATPPFRPDMYWPDCRSCGRVGARFCRDALPVSADILPALVGTFVAGSYSCSLRLGVGDGRRSDSEGGKQGRRKWRSDRAKLPTEARGCVVLKLERARAEQSEQHGRRGAWRRGAERVLVPADFRSVVAGSSCGCPSNERVARGPVSDPKFSPSHSPDPKIAQGTPVYRLHWSDPDTVASDLAQCE